MKNFLKGVLIALGVFVLAVVAVIALHPDFSFAQNPPDDIELAAIDIFAATPETTTTGEEGADLEEATTTEPETQPQPLSIQEFLHINPMPEGFVADNAALPWSLILVNRYNFLDEGFAPSLASVGSGHYIDERAAQSLLDMLQAARDADLGLRPIVTSSTRSISHQRNLFNNQVQRQRDNGLSAEDAFEAARRVVAYPGSSEHNLGLAVDIVAYDARALTAAFGQTPEGLWLAQNAHYFGFIVRYPYHKQHITNIIYEPWHFRYVGAVHAIFMFENDVVLEEYIFWRLNGYD